MPWEILPGLFLLVRADEEANFHSLLQLLLEGSA